VLFIACAANELFFIALYLLCFSSPLVTPALKFPSGTVTELPMDPKPSILFASPFSAAAMELARANKMDSTVPWILTIASAPIMAFKQGVNVVQLVKASKWLAEGDRRDRKRAGLPKQNGTVERKKEL
jgi:CDP-diacylglycerol--inositol 3-phosphatidyltransferase